jgi:hypothetical protein
MRKKRLQKLYALTGLATSLRREQGWGEMKATFIHLSLHAWLQLYFLFTDDLLDPDMTEHTWTLAAAMIAALPSCFINVATLQNSRQPLVIHTAKSKPERCAFVSVGNGRLPVMLVL